MCRFGQDDLLTFKPNIQMKDAKYAAVIFWKAWIYWEFAKIYRESSEEGGNNQRAAVLFVKMPCCCQMSEGNG